MEDYESLLTPEQVSVYRCNDVVRKSTNFFCQINEDREFQLTSLSYCYMRDHLFVEIVLSNASRSGPLANMMVEEFKKATVEDDGITVIAVKKHKTSATYGHTRICLKPMIFGYLKVFVEKVRPKLKTSIQNVFVSFTGQKMQPGAITKQINERLKEANTFGDSKRPPKNISCSRIRKSATTGTREAGFGNEKDVADLMSHDISTAYKHYNLVQRHKSAIQGHQTVAAFFDGLSPPKRRKFSMAQEEVIKTAFSDQTAQKKVTMEDVNQVIDAIPIQISKKELLDKVRNFCRYDQSHFPPQEEEMLDQKVDRLTHPYKPVVSASEKSQQEISTNVDKDALLADRESDSYRDDDLSFTESFIPQSRESTFKNQDIKTLRILCASLISGKPVNTETIKCCLKTSSEGRNMLKKYKINQLQTRIYYERKLKN